MADFDPFGDDAVQQNQPEEDPAAAFLAREQDQLAELEDDNFGISASSEQQTLDQYDALATDAPAADAFGVQAAQLDTGDSLLDEFDPTITTTSDFSEAEPSGPSDLYASITVVDQERAEPEKIQKWREDQIQRLEKKDAEAEEKQAEWRAIAAKELEDWYKHQQEQLEKTKKNNRVENEIKIREAEASFVQERDESMPGHEFERICRLCEFNPKGTKTQKDVSRMRSILLQLKQSPLVR